MRDGTLGIWVVRKEAEKLGRYLEVGLGGRLGGLDCVAGKTNRDAFASRYATARQWVLVMTTGIAVRYLKDLIKDKGTDPGVVVIDEGSRFAVSLVGGHEGGANFLAYRVANLTGALPVITTATEALKPLVVGLGCRKGARVDQIDRAVWRALLQVSRVQAEVREIATIDLKGEERGIVEWCERAGLPLRVLPRTLIRARPWVTNASTWVQEKIGVAGVCEPCALLATFHGRLILPKTITDGVAVAIVEEAPGL